MSDPKSDSPGRPWDGNCQTCRSQGSGGKCFHGIVHYSGNHCPKYVRYVPPPTPAEKEVKRLKALLDKAGIAH